MYVDRNTFAFEPTKTSQDLQDAFDRYFHLIFDHQVPDIARSNDVVMNKVIVEVDDLDVPLQLGVNESYTLEIPDDGSDAKIHAATVYGAYHAIETFSQIVVYSYNEKKYIMEAAPYKIYDYPTFQHRGILLDTARHFESLPTLEKFVDGLTYAKFNTLHWHITDDESAPIESRVFPKFFNGSYTQYERYSTYDVMELVEYARKRGIRVEPEFDVPGHASSWCRGIPEICPSDTCRTPLDVSNDYTYEFLEKFFGEFTGYKTAAGLFPENFFHLGGDEVNTDCWRQVDRIQKWLNEKGMTEMEAYHYIVDKAAKIVLAQGRRPVNWEEVWNAFGTKLDNRTIIHVWLHHETVAKVANSHYDVIVSNNDNMYIDHEGLTWETIYGNDLLLGVNEENYKHVLGGEVCMWSERIDISDLFNTVWPRAAAAAERMWSKKEDLDVVKASDRLKWFRCYLDRREINAAPVVKGGRPAPPEPGSCFTQ